MDKIEKVISDVDVANKLIKIYQSASSRGIEFGLTLSKVKRELKRTKCFYTGLPLNDTDGSPMKRSFERIDNSKGYIDSNVFAVGQQINQKKGDLSIEQIMAIAKTVKKLKISK